MTLGAYDLNQTASFAEGCTPIRCSHADTVDLPCLVSLSFFAANCALLASLYAPGSRRLHSSPREEVDVTKRNARMHTQTHTQTRIRLYAPTRLFVNVAFHHTQSRAVSEYTHTHTHHRARTAMRASSSCFFTCPVRYRSARRCRAPHSALPIHRWTCWRPLSERSSRSVYASWHHPVAVEHPRVSD